jgi:hypothetical protein
VLAAEERVVLLLRTMHDARVEWDDRADGGGALLMPRVWRDHYMELERSLIELREWHRRHWWHVTHRYLFGTVRLLIVPVGPKRTIYLPLRTELVAGGPAVGSKLARVRVYQWDARVDDGTAKRGVELLTSMMYDGERDRINLPPDLHARAVADKLVAA